MILRQASTHITQPQSDQILFFSSFTASLNLLHSNSELGSFKRLSAACAWDHLILELTRVFRNIQAFSSKAVEIS